MDERGDAKGIRGGGQPMPEECAISYVDRDDGRVETVVALAWAEGDPARCGLCPLGYCTAGAGRLCVRRIGARVEPADAWQYPVGRMDDSASFRDDDPRLVAASGLGGPALRPRRLEALVYARTRVVG